MNVAFLGRNLAVGVHRRQDVSMTPWATPLRVLLLTSAFAAMSAACGASTTAEPESQAPNAKGSSSASSNATSGPAPEAKTAATPKELLVTPPVDPPEPPPEPREHGLNGLLAAVPPLLWRHADSVEDDWYRVKAILDLADQARAVQNAKLEQTACKGLVNVRAVDASKAKFGYRDDVRGRTWARPVVGRILADALSILRQDVPEKYITIGDVSQPGCGQLEHGTLVRLLTDDQKPIVTRPGEPASPERVGAATAMINQARLKYGVPTVMELRQARELKGEVYRCAFPDEPVLIEHRIVAQDRTSEGKLLLKTVSRRYRPMLAPDEGDVAKFRSRVLKLMRAGAVLSQRKVPSWDPELGDIEVWVTHWASARLKQQMQVVSTKKLSRSFELSDLIEVRRAKWHARKPGSFKGERRWMAHTGEDGTQHWHRWKKMYEAGHITHLAGRDADLSYVTEDNGSHFRVNMSAIHVPHTWKWFLAMNQAAKAAGVSIDRIIVDRKVKRKLMAGLPKRIRRTPLWRKVRVVSGHDGHHHVRFTRASPRTEQKALDVLTADFGMKPPKFGLK